MGSYGRDEMHRSYEDLDEYEEDGEEYDDLEEAEEDAEEAEEEEDPKPTKEELDYLELRQKLKDVKRKQLKKETGASINSQEKKRKLPYDNFGSFFGPSQPVIAERVIRESKSLLETQHLTPSISRPHNNLPMKRGSTSAPNGGIRPVVRGPPTKLIQKATVTQKLKDNRDYSFLFSEDADLPAPKQDLPSRKVSVPNYDARSAQLASRSRQSTSSHSRPISNGHGDRNLVSTNQQSHNKADPRKALPTSRPCVTASDPRRQLGSNSGTGPGRPMVTKSLSSKGPAPTRLPISNRMQAPGMDRKNSSVGVKKPVPALQRAPIQSSKLHPGGQKQQLDQRRHNLEKKGQHLDQRGHHLDQRRDIREPDRAKQVSKHMVSSSRPQMKPPKQIQSRAPLQGGHLKKRPSRPFADEDEDDPISMIRDMFRYDPKKYASREVEDDRGMEVTFADIQREERRSSKIAKEEDERELRLIEEEERQERLRREAKKRKLR